MVTEERERVYEEIVKIFKKRKSDFDPGKTKIQYAGHVTDEREVIAVLDSLLDGWLGMGKRAAEFSKNLSSYLGVPHTVLTNSGSSANLLAVSALMSKQIENRLERGDEAIIPAGAAFPTTLNPIIQNGLKPVVVDIEVGAYNTTPDKIRSALSDKTRLIVIPHTLGNPNEMDEIMKIAKENDMFVIEDTCDALGSKFKNKMCGTFGIMGTFSFYPAHHMTIGEGGAVTTSDGKLKMILRSIRNWGRACFCEWDEKSPNGACGKRLDYEIDGIQYDHRYTYSNIGYNLKPLDLQAAIGIEQLKKLPDFNRKRKENFRVLYEGLSKYEDFFVLPESFDGADPVWFAFPLTIKEGAGFTRRDITKWLENNVIQTRVLFSGNITRQPAYKKVGFRISGDLKNSDKVMKDSFFVGLYPGIGEVQIKYMIEKFSEFLKK